jgi:hypothetical protein
MSQRDDRIDSVLLLLSQITGEKSLAFMARTNNPEKVQKAHRELYDLYTNPSLTNLLSFKLGYIPKRNKWCNTWILNAPTNLGMALTCPVCNENSYLFIQIDTSDACFLKPNKTAIFHIYTCNKACCFTVLSASEEIYPDSELMPNLWMIAGFNTVIDSPEKELAVPAEEKKSCSGCTGDTPIILKTVILKPRSGSKTGGYSRNRIFLPFGNTRHNEAALFGQKTSKLPGQTLSRCKCFDVAVAKELLCITTADVGVLSKKNVSQVRMFLCADCRAHNIVIYTETLNTGYSSIILESDDSFYHIFRSEDIMNGVVLAVDKRKSDVTAVSYLTDFKYKEEDRIKLKYSEISPLIPKQYPFLEKLGTVDCDDDHSKTRKFITFLRRHMDSLAEDEEIEVMESPIITKKFGKGFYFINNCNLLKGCLISIAGESEVMIYGSFVSPFEQVLPLSIEQEKVAKTRRLILGDIASLVDKTSSV